MDPSHHKVPYTIPGPAGASPDITPSQSASQAPNSLNAYRFHQSPWHDLMRQLQAPPYGERRLTSSIAILRARASKKDFSRLSNLPVLVCSVFHVGRDACVTLLDPSGSITATIHEQVFQGYRKGIEPGAALLLNDVAAVAYVENRPTGFRLDAAQTFHICVMLRNVRDMSPSVSKQTSINLSRFQPNESYEIEALKPPVLEQSLCNRVHHTPTALPQWRIMALSRLKQKKPRQKKQNMPRVGIRNDRQHVLHPGGRKTTRRDSQVIRAPQNHEPKPSESQGQVKINNTSSTENEFDTILSVYNTEAGVEDGGKPKQIRRSLGKRPKLISSPKAVKSKIGSLFNDSDDSDFM